MRSRVALFPLVALLACGGGSDSTTNPPPGGGGGGGGGGNPTATTAVDMKNITFTPAAIKVSPSATVTWTNSDNIAHNVTFDGGVGASGNFSSGTAALVMPATAGTYAYHCTIHGVGMSGTVLVQ